MFQWFKINVSSPSADSSSSRNWKRAESSLTTRTACWSCCLPCTTCWQQIQSSSAISSLYWTTWSVPPSYHWCCPSWCSYGPCCLFHGQPRGSGWLLSSTQRYVHTEWENCSTPCGQKVTNLKVSFYSVRQLAGSNLGSDCSLIYLLLTPFICCLVWSDRRCRWTPLLPSRWWWWWNTCPSLDSSPGTAFTWWPSTKINRSSPLASWAWRRLTTISNMICCSCWFCSSTDPFSWSVPVLQRCPHLASSKKKKVSYRVKATRMAAFHFFEIWR